jgi:uncharacterized BrkB/YihY/UPF0761 family membrane protein
VNRRPEGAAGFAAWHHGTLASYGSAEMVQRVGMVGIVSTIAAVLVAVLSVVLPPVQPDQLRSLPIVVVVLVAIAALVFFLVVPRGERSNRPAVPGLVCAIIGLLLVFPAFWSGLPIVLGAAGYVLGQAGRGGRQTTGGGLALGPSSSG